MPVHRMTAGLRQGKNPVSETLLHDRSRGMEEVKGGLEESKGNATEGTGTALWRRTVPQSKAAILLTTCWRDGTCWTAGENKTHMNFELPRR